MKNIGILLRRGDVIAFDGDSVLSRAIKAITGGPISHVGIVVMGSLGPLTSRVLLMESMSVCDLSDPGVGKVVKGVQIHWLSRRVAMFNGRVACYPLKEPLSKVQINQMLGWMNNKYMTRTDYDLSQAIGSGFDLLDFLGFVTEPDFDKLFCSELTVKALQVAGVISGKVNPSECHPTDAVSFDCFANPVSLKVEPVVLGFL